MQFLNDIDYTQLTPNQKVFVESKVKNNQDVWWINYANSLIDLILQKKDPRFVRVQNYLMANCKKCKASNHIEVSDCWECGAKLKFRNVRL